MSTDENMWIFGSVNGGPEGDFQDYLLQKERRKKEEPSPAESHDSLSDLCALIRDINNDSHGLDPESPGSSAEALCL